MISLPELQGRMRLREKVARSLIRILEHFHFKSIQRESLKRGFSSTPAMKTCRRGHGLEKSRGGGNGFPPKHPSENALGVFAMRREVRSFE